MVLREPEYGRYYSGGQPSPCQLSPLWRKKLYEKAFQQRKGSRGSGGERGEKGVGAVCDVRDTKTVDAPQFATGSLSTILRRHEAETAVPGHRLGVVGEVPIGKSLDEPNLIQALAKIVNGRVRRCQAAAANVNVSGLVG